jgi:tetratricopeptide (TPR) repeat protein
MKTIVISISFIALNLLFSAPPIADAADLKKFSAADFAISIKNWDRAISLLSDIIKANPKLYRAYHNRAVAYSKKGMYNESLADLQTAVKLNPKSPDSYALMGLVLDIKKDYSSALGAFQKAMKLEKRPEVRKTLAQWIKDTRERIKGK